ncbi:MAG: response regulator, partial [Oceanospirillum sp.]|nr:response regulator [Oceanospirillum sp.]
MNNFSTPVKKHLMVIDDEQDICELVSDVAEMIGFTSDQCSVLNDLAELELVPMPDILALDLSMPEVDGIEIINYLGSLPNKPQLILMTGFERSVLDGAHKLADRLDVPVLGQLSKPFSIQMLKELLEKPLETNELRAGSHKAKPVMSTFNPAEIPAAIRQGQF